MKNSVFDFKSFQSKVANFMFTVDKSLANSYLIATGIEPYNIEYYTDKEITDTLGGDYYITKEVYDDYIDIDITTEYYIVDVRNNTDVFTSKYSNDYYKMIEEVHDRCKLLGEDIKYQVCSDNIANDMVYPYTCATKETDIRFYKDNARIVLHNNHMIIDGTAEIVERRITNILDDGSRFTEHEDIISKDTKYVSYAIPYVFVNRKNKRLQDILKKSKFNVVDKRTKIK